MAAVAAAALALTRRRASGGSLAAAAACWQAAAAVSMRHPLGPQPNSVRLSTAADGIERKGRESAWAGPGVAYGLHVKQQCHPRLHHLCQQHHGSSIHVPWSLRQYSTDNGSSGRSSSSAGSSRNSLEEHGTSCGSRDGAAGPATSSRQSGAVEALKAAGWSRAEVLNVPNALSMLRLLSGPVIASWILDAQWSLALPALAVSGATDWADGWAARRFNQPSVVGSYLDPLADKVLICSVVGALGWSGVLPGPVVGIIVGRDVLLVTGAFAARAKSLGWRWPGVAEFFRVGSPAPAAPLVQPLYISKVNTVFQLGLVGTCILHSWLGWPGEGAVWAASALTAGTTAASCAAYFQAYRQGRVLTPAVPGGGSSSRAGGSSRGGASAGSSTLAGRGSSSKASSSSSAPHDITS